LSKTNIVNDPVPVPPASPSHGSYHWTFDRIIAASLIPLTVAPFAAGSLNPTMDAILCATILIHSHTGLQAVIIDYVPTKRLPKTRKLFTWGLNAATVVIGLALYEFETTDVGLTETVKRIWKA
jgi:succinate dehydrogenase (ubiquinone) membrane anchor subunit